MTHKVTILNPDTRYGECSVCGKHRSFRICRIKKTKKGDIPVWECLKRRTPTGKKPLAVRKKGRRYQNNKLDDMWKEAVHLRGQCEMREFDRPCNGRLEAHHLIKRSNYAVRHDPENGLLICTAHHFMAENMALTFNAEVSRRFPGRLERLEKKRMEMRGKKRDLSEDHEVLSNLLKVLKNE